VPQGKYYRKMHFSFCTLLLFALIASLFELRMCYKLCHLSGEFIAAKQKKYGCSNAYAVAENFEDPYRDLLNFNKQLDPVRLYITFIAH